MGWWKSLPTEYQLTLSFAALAILAWLIQLISPVLQGSFNGLLMFFGTLSGGAMTHGVFARRAGADASKDLKGDTP